MSEPTDRLYALLPAWHRARDAEQGEPLRALLRVLEREMLLVRDDIEQLGDDSFIETCAEWAVPYIGEQLGVRALNPLDAPDFSLRGYVANTIGYRRRKGTAPVIEQVAYDLTRWPAHAVEFFQRLSTTQSVKHVRPDALATANFRDGTTLARVGSPFARVGHSVDVRRIARERGQYNIPNVGVFLWRLRDYTLTEADVRPYDGSTDGRFLLDWTGRDVPMYNPAQREDELAHLATEANVPGPLSRRRLWEELESGRTVADPLFVGERPFEVMLGGVVLTPDQLCICDLADIAGDWQRPTAPRLVGIDPERGRVVLADPASTAEVRVSWTTALSGDAGGGPYDRRASVAAALVDDDGTPLPISFQRGVSRRIPPVTGEVVATLVEAITAWNASTAANGIIVLMDSAWFEEDLTALTGTPIEMGAGRRLLLTAAEWPDPPTGSPNRTVGQVVAQGRRAAILGDLDIVPPGTPPAATVAPSVLVLDGVWVDGAVTVRAADLGRLRIAHATLVPGKGGLAVAAGNPSLAVELDHAFVGGVTAAAETAATLRALDTVIDGDVTAPDTALELDRTTVLGRIDARELSASDCILRDRVRVERQQTGCVRYSYVPDESRTARRFRCQPDLALAARAAATDWPATEPARERERNRVRRRLVPDFTSTRWSDPAYAQLGPRCADGVRTGAEGGSEMGAWCALQGPLREANLRAALPEYLRLGLEAGLFFVT